MANDIVTEEDTEERIEAEAESGADDRHPPESETSVEPDTHDHTLDAQEASPMLSNGAVTPTEPIAPPKNWYVVKVQSGREDTIRNALDRRVKLDGLEEYVGRILVPHEKVTEVKNGKRVVRKRKKFPGYIMVEVNYNENVLYLFRETSGVGDFVGGGLNRIPQPMPSREVERMLMDEGDSPATTDKKTEKIQIPYSLGDRVRVRDGTFAGMEGDVKEIIEGATPKENPKVKVAIMFWGRPVDVDVEFWQVDAV